MGCITCGSRDGKEVIHQPFDVGLPPAVPALPTRHDVLNLSVQEFEELDGLGVHDVALFPAAGDRYRCQCETGPRSGGRAAFTARAAGPAESLQGRVTIPRSAG